MTAIELVASLLDGIDPKFVLRHLAPRPPVLKMPTQAEVDFDLNADWEQDAPEDSFDNEEDIDFVREQIKSGNVWGWCLVEVKARYTTEDGEDVEASDWLGGCSYHSQADFMEPGGYYDGMKQEAYEALCAKLEKEHGYCDAI